MRERLRISGRSLEPGTSSRTSTPSRAESRKRLKQPGRRDQIGVGDPEPLDAAGGQQLDHPVGPLPARARR